MLGAGFQPQPGPHPVGPSPQRVPIEAGELHGICIGKSVNGQLARYCYDDLECVGKAVTGGDRIIWICEAPKPTGTEGEGCRLGRPAGVPACDRGLQCVSENRGRLERNGTPFGKVHYDNEWICRPSSGPIRPQPVGLARRLEFAL